MKIVLVCTGNVCRSAAAEAILKKMVAERCQGRVQVESCGTIVPPGLTRDEVMSKIAAEYGYDVSGTAVPMSEEMLNSADLIIAMTQYHRDELTRVVRYDRWNRIILFNEIAFGEKTDLPDPHYQTEKVYRDCFVKIEQGCANICQKLLDNQNSFISE